MTLLTSRAYLVCATTAALAATQPWIMLVIGHADVSSLTALSGAPQVAERMFTVLLAFMPAMFVAYWIATRHFTALYPVLGSFASYCFGLWFALELLPRSFDLLVVQGRWLPRFIDADAAGKAVLEQQYTFYRDAVHALGFVRRHVLLAGQLCLAICLWRDGLLGRLLSTALALSVVRLLLGSLALYAGMSALFAIADPLYFVTAGAIYPLLAAWAFKKSRPGPDARVPR